MIVACPISVNRRRVAAAVLCVGGAEARDETVVVLVRAEIDGAMKRR